MPGDASCAAPGSDASTRESAAEDGDPYALDDDSTSDDGGDRGLVDVGLESSRDPDSSGDDPLAADSGYTFGDDEDELPAGDATEHALGFTATSGDLGEHGVDLSPWAPLLGALHATEPEAFPGDQPFAPSERAKGPHALEMRAEAIRHYAERGAQRTGRLDRTEVGLSNDNRDVVAGRDDVEVDGMLDEHTGDNLVNIADDVEMNVGGPLTIHAHLEDNIIMAGTMRDEFAGGTFVTAAMSDDMAAGLGLRCTAPLDVWVHGLVGMEERPGTCAADGMLFELAGTLYEREYGPSAHVAAVARHSGTVATTMKTGFRPLMKVALGVRNLIPGGGGGGGSASASPPAPPPAAPPGGEAGAATLTAVESAGALGHGVVGGDDTDEIVSVVRTVENASDTAAVEELQHPASTADNLDALARVDVEGAGPRQVAEIYEQPIPASAAPQPGAGPGTGSAVADGGPALYRTEPGTEGYDFGKAYGSLRDRTYFYRKDSNWRGNIFMREYLGEIGAKATELFKRLGGSPDDLSIDRLGLRTESIHAALETMATEAETAGRLDDLADIRAAVDELEGLVNGTIADVAARIDEFSGAALGAQRVPIDPNIDTVNLRRWLEGELLGAQEQFVTAAALADPAARDRAAQLASWEAAYWIQLIKALDDGVNPLADSGEQISLIRVEKIDPHYAGFADEVAAAAANGYVLVVPPVREEEQLQLFLDLQDRLLRALSDTENFRSAEEMGAGAFAPPVPVSIETGGDILGPDPLRAPPGGVDEPDVTPVLRADDPPSPPPDRAVADPSPGAGSAAPDAVSPRREPPGLYSTRPGTEGYEYQSAYDSLHHRNLFYREEFNFRGNFFMREYLRELDEKAFELFTGLGGPPGAVSGDHFGWRTSSVYRTLEAMAADADAANDVQRATEIRAAMGEIEALVDDAIVEVAARTGEFSGSGLGSQRGPIDRNIDTAKLRTWLEQQAQNAQNVQMSTEDDRTRQLASWEWGYYHSLITWLDEGVNPLAVSNEQIAILRINHVDPHRAQFADEIAAAAAEGRAPDIPRHPIEDEIDLYARLQDRLVRKLEKPKYHRSAEVMGLDAFAAGVRERIVRGYEFLGPDSLRPLVGGDVPPPLPAADFAGRADYVDEVRDRSFARSALAASEETLERQAAGLAEGDAATSSPASDPGSGAPEPSLGTRRAPPDSAWAPIIDEGSGRWVLEPSEQSDVSPGAADGASPQTSDVSWHSGLQGSGDSGIGPAAGSAGDADTQDLFRAVAEPEDADPASIGEARHPSGANDDGASVSPGSTGVSPWGKDGNPTGAFSEPDDVATTPGHGGGTGPGPSDTTSRVAAGTPDPVSTGVSGHAPGTPALDGGADGAGTRSNLYDEAVSFEGRSLEGAPRSDGPKELARPLDGAEVPVEDLARVEPVPAGPASRPGLESPEGRLVSDSYRDLHDAMFRSRREWAEQVRSRLDRDAGTAGGAWSRGRGRRTTGHAANARWTESAAAQRTLPVAFGDDPRRLADLVEHDAAMYPERGESFVDPYRGADPPNTIDRSHAAGYTPGPRGRDAAREAGFGRLSQGWEQYPFSHRERILNALSRGEALRPGQIAALESGLEGYRAIEGGLSSSQYRAMADMISDLGDRHRRARWHMHGWRRQRLLQLIEMLDWTVGVV